MKNWLRDAWLDKIAITASMACLVHCLALPLLLAALPSLVPVLHLPESFHRYALLIAVPASALALASGYRRHRSSRPAVGGIAGLAIMAFAAFGNVSLVTETLLSVFGSLAVAAAHIGNWRSARCGSTGRVLADMH